MFNHAIADEELTRNPFKGLARKTRGRRDKVPLVDAELDRLCEYGLHGAHGAQMRALILFAPYSGTRPSELFALRWSDVDSAAMRIHVCHRLYKGRLGPPSNGHERMIVLTEIDRYLCPISTVVALRSTVSSVGEQQTRK
jgi:integrase